MRLLTSAIAFAGPLAFNNIATADILRSSSISQTSLSITPLQWWISLTMTGTSSFARTGLTTVAVWSTPASRAVPVSPP